MRKNSDAGKGKFGAGKAKVTETTFDTKIKRIIFIAFTSLKKLYLCTVLCCSYICLFFNCPFINFTE